MTSSTILYNQPLNLDSGTMGCSSCNMNCIYIPSGSQDAIRNLRFRMVKISTDSIRRQVESFCSCLSAGIIRYGIDDTLPEFYIISEEDEFYLEWIFDYFRFGFDFCDDPQLSGWFILMKQNDGIFRFNSEFKGDYRKAVDYALSVIGKKS